MAPVKYATLVANDGLEFTLPRDACLVSPMLKASFLGNFTEGKTARMTLPEFR